MSTRSARRLLGAALVLALPLTGCTAPSTAPRPAAAPPMKLVAFDSCAELLADMRAAARRSFGRYELLDGFQGGTARFSGVAPATGGAVAEHSGTNNHEVGADEPDLVKTDGRRIVVAANGRLRVIDAATRTETGRLSLGRGRLPADLFLVGDHALVMAPLPPEDPPASSDRRLVSPVHGWTNRYQVRLVDLTGKPKIISTYAVDGRMVDARLTGNTARVVVTNVPRFALPSNIYDTADPLAAYRKLVDEAPIETWQPAYEVTTAGRTEKGRVGCDRISRPAAVSGTSMVTVLTFDVAGGSLGTGDPVSVVADGETVYGTGSSLYIATNRHWWHRADATSATAPQTEIHRFDTGGTGTPRYVASGTVPGRLLNQYALSEWDGHLRVATTEDPDEWFGREAPTSAPKVSSSAVRVLRQRGGELVEVGTVDGLGRDERIYSVRFIGDRGYVVTFRQTDPLYSLDLSDPAKPAVTGELKITGYSAHLQPAGDGRLIGIGQEADRKGLTKGTQISLFDVENPADPRRLARHHVPGGHSEAEYNPHALLWWPATNTLVAPMSHADGRKSTALVLRVTDAGITRAGEITHRRAERADGPAQINRTLVVGDVLWTVSDAGVLASSLSTLQKLTWLPTA
ncbi:MAG TPA: beta-propeller domain-containing protein [Actinoplanes sp.]|nr:beta-propeller domain-containing protein [Actinoplanes sp.]